MKRNPVFQVMVTVMIVALVTGGSLALAAEQTAATAQEMVPHAVVAAKILPQLKNENPEVRAAMARLLGEMCCKDAANALVELMKSDKVAGVRMIAANALAKAKEYRVIVEIREQAQKDQNKTVRTVLNAIADQMEREKSLASS
ncbi:MAG TPA: HEAT repeat domain-containing protein [bacterium]|nr:HEAT repeat domain-containing protein [bacterium]HQG44175.1 HEAT repeat domain-containing protein [bacterium]HQI50158.1 HEAT repeat domain-containing protein [bacterium]HQJ64592.1 HEAT repeat domain-containing protein [bacterium]